jgi:hypothetical protein
LIFTFRTAAEVSEFVQKSLQKYNLSGMLSSLHYLLLSAISASLAHCRGDGEPPTKRDLIILTDMEPDDRIALAMVASQPELAKRLLFVGTTLLNTNLKAALVRRQLEQTGLGHVKVFAGTGVVS